MGAIEFPEEFKKKTMISSIKRGDILAWEKYEFSDGTTKDKLVLILSDCIEDSYYTIALPTSKIEGYVDGRRQFIDTICFPKGNEACFPLDTVIDLKNLDTVEIDELTKGIGKNVTFSRSTLSVEGLRQVMEAVKSAHTLTPKQKQSILQGWS